MNCLRLSEVDIFPCGEMVSYPVVTRLFYVRVVVGELTWAVHRMHLTVAQLEDGFESHTVHLRERNLMLSSYDQDKWIKANLPTNSGPEMKAAMEVVMRLAYAAGRR